MKADMRVPQEPDGEYLLIIEAETALEQGALAHFARYKTAGAMGTEPAPAEELRIIFAAPSRSPMFRDAPAVSGVFIAWDTREEPAATAISIEGSNG